MHDPQDSRSGKTSGPQDNYLFLSIIISFIHVNNINDPTTVLLGIDEEPQTHEDFFLSGKSP
jgi:hypothetical protein